MPSRLHLAILVLLVALFGCSTAPVAPSSPCDPGRRLANGLAGYWPLNQSRSLSRLDAVRATLGGRTDSRVQLIPDESGLGRYGIARGISFSSDVPNSRFVRSAYFDGDRSFVDLPEVSNKGDASLSLWLQQSVPKIVQVFGSSMPSSEDGEFALIVESGGRPVFIRWVDGPVDRWHIDARAPADTRIAPGRWYHLAGVYQSSSRTTALFLDGKPIASSSAVNFSPTTWWRGIGQGIGKYDFNGRIADVRVYHRALAREEIDMLAEGCIS